MPNYRYQAQDCQRRQGRGLPASRSLSDLPIAMAYVPWQEWCGILELEKGLCCGTIFEELNKPFTGAGGRR